MAVPMSGSALEKVERDKDICRDRARGLSWAKLAEKYDMDPRSCRKVWAAFAKQERPKMDDRDPIEVVWERAERYEHWIEQAAEIALTTEQDVVRIGALNTQMRLQEKQIDLLQQSGILPRDLGQLKVQMDVRYIVKRVLEVFRERGVPMDVQEEIITLVSPRSSN